MTRTIRCDFRDDRDFLCEGRFVTSHPGVDLDAAAEAAGWRCVHDSIDTYTDLCPQHAPDESAA